MKITFAAALLVLTAGHAVAGDITLTQAKAGSSLHTGNLDMNVYWTADEAAYEVVATYVTKDAPAKINRLRMHLAEGDRASFGLPGVQGRMFTFARNGGTVSVEAARVGVDIASR